MEHKRSNHRKYKLKQVKGVACGNLEDVLKINKKLVTTKRETCDQFLAKIKISEPVKAE